MRSNKRGEEKASHVVSAWSKEDGFCLGQKSVGEKSNEITAIPEQLEKIQIKGQIITIDAMGTQDRHSRKDQTEAGRLCSGIEEKPEQPV